MTGKGKSVELPEITVDEVSEDDFEFPKAEGRGKPAEVNHLLEPARIANENRGKVYQVQNIMTKVQAEKVIRLLAKAGKVHGCSFKTLYQPDHIRVCYQARDQITRPRTPKA